METTKSFREEMSEDIDNATEQLWAIGEKTLNQLLGDNLFREYTEEVYNWVRFVAELQLQIATGKSSTITDISMQYAIAGRKAFVCKIKRRIDDVTGNAIQSVLDTIINVAKVIGEKALKAGVILLFGEIGEYII